MSTQWKFMLSASFMEVHVSADGDQYRVSYAGNQGARLTNLERVFDGAFGAGAWQHVRACTHFKEKGSPDYFYQATFRTPVTVQKDK